MKIFFSWICWRFCVSQIWTEIIYFDTFFVNWWNLLWWNKKVWDLNYTHIITDKTSKFFHVTNKSSRTQGRITMKTDRGRGTCKKLKYIYIYIMQMLYSKLQLKLKYILKLFLISLVFSIQAFIGDGLITNTSKILQIYYNFITTYLYL